MVVTSSVRRVACALSLRVRARARAGARAVRQICPTLFCDTRMKHLDSFARKSWKTTLESRFLRYGLIWPMRQKMTLEVAGATGAPGGLQDVYGSNYAVWSLGAREPCGWWRRCRALWSLLLQGDAARCL